jgi:type II secretion system protein G
MKKGFTLLELLVVISIIGLLSSVVLASVNSARENARDTKRISDLREVRTALEMYYTDNGFYPNHNNSQTSPSVECGTSGGNAWWSLLSTALSPKYISKMPQDIQNGQNTFYYCGDKPNAEEYILGVKMEKSSNINRSPFRGQFFTGWNGDDTTICQNNYFCFAVCKINSYDLIGTSSQPNCGSYNSYN